MNALIETLTKHLGFFGAEMFVLTVMNAAVWTIGIFASTRAQPQRPEHD